MATAKPLSKSATSEEALRDRIHRLFSGDVPSAREVGEVPHFWEPPTQAQRDSGVLELHDGLELQDEIEVLPEERRWLETPHMMLDGHSPAEMLNGDQRSRERLERSLTDIEEAIAGGGGAFR